MKTTYLFISFALALVQKVTPFNFRGETLVGFDDETTCTEEDEVAIWRRIDSFFEDAANNFLHDDIFLDDFPTFTSANIQQVNTELPYDDDDEEDTSRGGGGGSGG
eukprot:CAMPEP_0194145754 /NCGR_PEP_ID=MMETSP0152-20130528/18813_1 /TAXON_ID=1049557 /ORGANISM="Thalassiothrix antarctica, Strain L6-D1" /LENGTH=105 /DNA_ID=CAMNT_0038846089 /DNA_START=82 /DNA_END=395 /DNA_ORIENTATION=+